MLRVLVATVLLSFAALAGCVTPALDSATTTPASGTTSALVPPAPDFDFSKVVEPYHASHSLPDLHAVGHGVKLSGVASIQSILPPGTRGSITQVDLWENYALVSGMEGGLAFAIVDITDAAKPKAVSWWPSAADGWTARFSEDGNFVFYGCQMIAGGPNGVPTTTSYVLGTCLDPTAPHVPGVPESGVMAIDVSDKAKPTFVDFVVTSAAHNLFVANISGTDYVFTNGVNIVSFDRAEGKLTKLGDLPGRHDATVHKHPITGDWLLITGTNELSIYNVNDPADPAAVFVPEESQRDAFVAWHEQTLVPGIVDGRVILVGAGETGVQREGGVPDVVYFLDITDPTKPEVLSQWKPPFTTLLPWNSYQFSVHEIAATPTGQVAIAWYHAGAWVLDVSTRERQAEPVVLAAYQPHEPMTALPSTFFQTPVPLVPFVWGIGWDERGYLVVPDMHTGLYMLEPDWGLHPTGMTGGGQ